MAPYSNQGTRSPGPMSAARRSEILHSLIPVASCAANVQLDAFAVRLTDALFAFSEKCGDAKDANLSFNASFLLKKNVYAFYFLASSRLEELLQQEVKAAEQKSPINKLIRQDDVLSLVTYKEMDNKVLLSNMSRPVELKNADELTALSMRMTCLLEQDEITLSRNPFRPEVFFAAINDAWCEFDPDQESHHLILPLLQPDVFLDLSPVLQALNDALIARGILPQLSDAYRIKKTSGQQDAAADEAPAESALAHQLRQFFSEDGSAGGGGNGGGQGGQGFAGGGAGHLQEHLLQATAVSHQLLGYLAGMQKNMFDQHESGMPGVDHLSAALLGNIKSQAPQGALTRVDENTIDLLTSVFDVVFRDQNIPYEIKALIGFLQVPVLKAALLDKNFFFQEEHPARRLIDTLTKSSMAMDQNKGQEDPLYQMVKRIVEKVQREYDQETSVFSDGVSDLENYLKEDEASTADKLTAPVADALKQEKIGLAKKSAKTEVVHRIGTGEVVAFVEAFLERKWVPVLTIAYTLQEEKPQAVESAIKTMDDLIWSVKPKITLEQRKELISKLPSILGALNKWLNIVKWEDTDRLQFFADLAECHASIVRAPLAMSPEKRLEIAVEEAKKAAERRIEKRAAAPPEPVVDEFDEKVKKLERGMWLNLTSKDGETKKIKLSWVSPMHTLYIFTTTDKKETCSMPAEELAQTFRENRAEVVMLGGVVDRALSQAMERVGANDAMIGAQAA